jgi:NADP-dependent 3-hydroxy acid dehydrogenase YdfG
MPPAARSALVLGARNLGGSIAAALVADGWAVACVARSDDSLERARSVGALPIRADAYEPADVERAVREAEVANGPVTLLVNAVSASRSSGGPWGGGPIAEASLQAIRDWCTPVAEQALIFLATGARTLRANGGGTMIQVTGGSARRALPGRGAWAAGAHATRALVHAAAQELREEGIQVALLIVDATIASPKTADRLVGAADDATTGESDVADAVRYLAGQTRRAMSHELMITPAGDRWLP